jgi:DNA-binding CsgD family transcriptional regulator
MRKLSQLQYEVIFLYSKGFTFKEIDEALATASKGAYTQK